MSVISRIFNSTDLQSFLDDRGLDAEILRLETLTPTVETAAQALGVEVGAIVKSLLFLVDGEPVLAVACGTARVDNRLIAAEYGVGRKHVKLAAPEVVIDIAGYVVGAMPPFGHRQQIPTLIDPAVVGQKVVYAGGGDDNAMMRIRVEDLKRVTGGKVVHLQESALDLENPLVR